MMQLHQDYQEFAKRDTIIVAIGPDSKEKHQRYFKEKGFAFYGLPDPKGEVLKKYGQEVNLFKLGRMPAQMLIDKEGILRYVHYGHSMKDFPGNDEILSLIDGL